MLYLLGFTLVWMMYSKMKRINKAARGIREGDKGGRVGAWQITGLVFDSAKVI